VRELTYADDPVAAHRRQLGQAGRRIPAPVREHAGAQQTGQRPVARDVAGVDEAE
jgi:hypothetical protein